MSAQYQLEAVLAFCRRVDEALEGRRLGALMLHPDDRDRFDKVFFDCPEGVEDGLRWHPFISSKIIYSRSTPVGRALLVVQGTPRTSTFLDPDCKVLSVYEVLARSRLVDLPWRVRDDSPRGPYGHHDAWCQHCGHIKRAHVTNWPACEGGCGCIAFVGEAPPDCPDPGERPTRCVCAHRLANHGPFGCWWCLCTRSAET